MAPGVKHTLFQHLETGAGPQPTSFKLQASSNKLQASSSETQAASFKRQVTSS